MLNLSGDDRRQLRQGIEAAYPTPSELKIFVDGELDINLALISTADSHRTVIFDLIQWAIARGYIDDLILALSRDTQNPQIQKFCRRVLPQYLRLNFAEEMATEPRLAVELNDWDLAIDDGELQSFLPRQFSFEADVGTLQRGLDLAGSVCKITFVDRSPQEGGTGVLIASNLVLTNYHVLSLTADADLEAIAKSAQFEFGNVSPRFGKSRQTQTMSTVDHDPVVSSSPIRELDYVLLRLRPETSGFIQPVPFKPTAQVQPRSALNILQHPEGEQMKVSLSNNGVVKTNDRKGLVLYVNPTRRGSSGSPCFDQDWNLIALHHKELATNFGSVREGILFRAIYEQISSVL